MNGTDEQPTPQDFYLTFPQRFRDHEEEHLTFPAAHPDGYVRITARNYYEAREYAFATFGSEWCFLYSHDQFTTQPQHVYYPLGELTHHTVGATHAPEPTC